MAREVDEAVEVQVDRRLLPGSVPPRLAHKFNYVRVGDQIVFEVGHFDLRELAAFMQEAKGNGGELSQGPSLLVTNQFAMSPTAALDLYAVAKQLFEDLVASGLVVEGSGGEDE